MPKSKKKGSTTPDADPKKGASSNSRRVNYRDRVNDRQLEEALKKSKEIATVGPSSSGKPTSAKTLAKSDTPK